MSLAFGFWSRAKKGRQIKEGKSPILKTKATIVYQHVFPLCYRLYSITTNIAWLTEFTITHAVKFTKAICDARVIAAADEPPEILRFEEAASTSVAAADGDELDDDSITSNMSFAKHLTSLARRVFRIQCLRPKQIEAVDRIINDLSSEGNYSSSTVRVGRRVLCST